MIAKTRTTLCTILLAGVAFSVTACADEDADSLANDPPAACDALLDKMCEVWLVPCDSTITFDQCVASVESGLPNDCVNAIGVGASYEACMSDVDSATCGRPTAPKSCRDVILFGTAR